MTDNTLTGGCYCGDIRYRIESEILRSTTCRCATCARTAGTHAIAWLTVPSDSVILIAGEPTHRIDGTATRTFCGRCGTKLTYRDNLRGETDVTVSSLDRGPALTEASVSQDTIHHQCPKRGTVIEPRVAVQPWDTTQAPSSTPKGLRSQTDATIACKCRDSHGLLDKEP